MIEVQKYNPQWSNRFQSLSSQFLPHIQDLSLEVLHVGRTAIKGLSSEPVIDINIVVDDFSHVSQISEKLRLVGYIPASTEVSEGKYVFNHNKSVPHSLQIVQKDNLVLKSQLLLKKHLEENSKAFKEYEALKMRYSLGKMPEAKFNAAERKLRESYLISEGFTKEELEQIH